jgi:2,3-bisphosphoglycerate-dependent phosphoglycerate mutase
MELVLIRHGQPEWMRDDLNVENPPLTKLGHHQAKCMAAALAGEEFDEVLVSPLLRARQTAAPLYEALGRDEVIDEWLQEIGDPNWHGTPYSLAQEAYGFMARHGGTRVDGELPVWKLDNPDQRIAMVAHAGTNSMALGHLLGVDPVPWQWERFQLHHTSVTRLETFELGDGHAFGMSALGNAEHLALNDRTR